MPKIKYKILQNILLSAKVKIFGSCKIYPFPKFQAGSQTVLWRRE